MSRGLTLGAEDFTTALTGMLAARVEGDTAEALRLFETLASPDSIADIWAIGSACAALVAAAAQFGTDGEGPVAVDIEALDGTPDHDAPEAVQLVAAMIAGCANGDTEGALDAFESASEQVGGEALAMLLNAASNAMAYFMANPPGSSS